MLEKINSPKDLKKLNINELNELANEIREVLLNKILKVGGHLGPNLGVIELTIALHYVFNSPTDKIVFDVSHQTYTHKILTNRKQYFLNEDLFTKVSGFSTPKESEHDLFKIGHTSTSVSLALGLAKARDLKNEKYNVISIIGDGSLSGGEAFEGLDNASLLKSNFIIIVNDNEMSISTNVGGLYDNLAKLRETNGNYQNNFFKSLGYDYLYLEEGNNINKLVEVLNKVKDINHPIVLHIHTLKGNGYQEAILNKEKYHFINGKNTPRQFMIPDVTKNYLIDRFNKQKDFVVVNAATPVACGIDQEFKDIFKEHFIDVGICEQHAVSLISGLAKNNLHPIFLVMANFLQRSYDQLNQDLALNDLKATIVLFNARINGGDATHVGMFDIGMLSNIPNLTLLAPTNVKEYLEMLEFSFNFNHPVIIRAPIEVNLEETNYSFNQDNYLKYQINHQGSEVALIALGSMMLKAKEVVKELNKYDINPTLINPRIYSTLDEETLSSLIKNHQLVVTFEDGILDGGFGEKIASFYGNKNMKVISFGAKKDFNDLKSLEEINNLNHLNVKDIVNDILNNLKKA